MKKNAFLNEAGTNPPVNATRTRTMATRAILLLFLIFTSLSAFAEVGDIVEDENGLKYNILSMPDGGNNGTVEVGDNTEGYSGEITIPADITISGSGSNDGTYDVVRIGGGAFWAYDVYLPLNLSGATKLTTIGDNAFNECGIWVHNLTIPASVTTIGSGAFMNDWGLSGCLTIPASVTTIGDCAFLGCVFTSMNSAMRDLRGVVGEWNFYDLIEKPLTCAPELAYIHANYGFRYVTVEEFAPSITINDGVTQVEAGGTFTVSIDLRCAPEEVLTSDILTITNGIAGTWTCEPYDNDPDNISTPAKTIATCVISPSGDEAVTVQVQANAFTFFDTPNSASNIVGVNLPTVVSATPADEAENVSCMTDAISVTFSKTMDTGSGTLTGSPAITGEGEWSDDDKTYTYTLSAALTPETAYTITLTDFMDTGSAALFGNSFSFTTKKTPTASDIAYTIPTNHVYTGSAQGIGTVIAGDEVTGLGAITVKYNGNAAAPRNAGTYTVTVDVAEGTQYNAVTGLALGNYTMATKAVTITGLTAQNKVYDGTTTATATGGTLSGIILGDQVSIAPGTATFATAEVANGITVTFSGYGITGTDVANYHLAGQPAAGSANILPPTYGVSTGSFSGGSVSTDKTSAQEGETITLTINPDQDYVLDEISAYQTSSPHTVVALDGSGLTRTFTMPAYGVTVTATFKTQAQVDQETVEAAKAAIEGGTYHVAQATANDAEAVKAWLVTTLDVLFGQSHGVQFRSATSTVGDVTVTALTPAVAGTENHPEGSNGSFSFTVALTKEAGAITATVTTGVITATAFTPQKRIDLSLIDDLTIRILNTGNVTTGELTLALSGANANAFTLPSTRVSSMPVTAYAHVTLTPRAGLADGIYTATLTVSEDGTTLATIDITYTVTTTGLADIPTAKALKAWMQDGGLLHVTGLTAGQPWSVHTISGALIHYNIADSHEATVHLTARGVYIIKSGAAVVKTAY